MQILNPKPLFSERFHEWLFLSGIAITLISLPNSVYMSTVGQLVVAGNWLMEGRYSDKVKKFWNNKAAVAFASIFMIYLISMLWTSDFSRGGSILLTVLPVFTYTFLVAGSIQQTSREKVMWLLLLFSLSVLVTTFLGIILFDDESATSNRQYSPFVSHIRLGMMIVFSIYLFPWLVRELKHVYPRLFSKKRYFFARLMAMICSLWLLIFLFFLQTLSSYAILLATILFLGFYFLYSHNNRIYFFSILTTTFLILIVLVMVFARFYSMVAEKHPVDFEALPIYSAAGNIYKHIRDNSLRENGHLVYILIQDDELEEAWNKVSKLGFHGTDNLGQDLDHTLYRYMASKGLTKDAEGFSQLTSEDIEAIEDGIANYLYIRWPGFKVRIHQTIWEIYQYREGSSIDGHTLNQRFEYWKAAISAIKKKPIIGWGVGDVREAMHYGFKEIDTPLSSHLWRKPHNQYLLLCVYFGLVGCLLTLLLIFYPVFSTGSWKIFPNVIFLIIVFVSMLSEDTIDNQVGLTFFITFYSIFNFFYPAERMNKSGLNDSI